MQDLTMIESQHSLKESLQPADLSETIYETGGESAEYSPIQYYIDESLQQLADITKHENPVFAAYLDQFAELLRNYIKEGKQDTEEQFDHRFGVYYDIVNDSFSIGDSILNFDGDDIIVKGVGYEGTPGLYDLLFRN